MNTFTISATGSAPAIDSDSGTPPRRHRATGIVLFATLALLTGVALIPARAERRVDRPERVTAPATRTPQHC